MVEGVMVIIRDRFPRTSSAYPDLMLWDGPFDWADPASKAMAIMLIQLQSRFALAGQREFLEYCDAVGDDIGAMVEDGAVGYEADTVDEYRLLFALKPMELCLVWGLNGQCHGWALWSLARNIDRDDRVFDTNYSFFAPESQAAPEFRDLAFANLPRWTAAFVMLARKFGGVDDVARSVTPMCWDLTEKMFRMGVNVGQSLEALTCLANWASNADEPQAEAWVKYLLRLWSGALPDANRAQIGIVMMSPAHRFTGRDPQDWADEMLSRWSHILIEHMELQVLAVSLKTIEDWRDRRNRILASAVQLARSYREQSGDDETVALQALESRVSIIHPLIWFLTEHGEVEDVLDVLGAWYVKEGERTCDVNVLFVASGHMNGVAYLWHGGRLALPRGEGPSTFDAVLAAGSLAQREYHRATAGGDDRPDIDYRRMGQPDEAAGPEFEAAARAHFEPSRLAAALPPGQLIRSVVTVPSLPAPVLALLATEGGIVAAEEVSLRQPLPVRPINRLAVWQGGTMHEGFEVEALERVAALAGWTIDVQGGDLAAFERFYTDPIADLLWIIGHGEHSPHRIERSGLVIGEAIVTADRLRGMVPAGEGRRLLVLNVCSGATAQMRGGMARIGIGQELTCPAQQVAAHLWPVGMFAALAFGAKFAFELSVAPTPEAYARTVAGMRDPAALRADLVTRLGPGLAIHDRLAHQDAQIGNAMAWGAPILLT
ncbi:hypothetical protein GCM10010833_07930 [Blastomonas aquatica]|uniref:CHAT domain-containing protein n=1 Tax=Blastomonas aquatica TaxID=1510276 RepID=A0ABQ1J1R3_9SPHN|nr:hypothetical protein GCM10010833_07930 [Blastomonas aquatica]